MGHLVQRRSDTRAPASRSRTPFESITCPPGGDDLGGPSVEQRLSDRVAQRGRVARRPPLLLAQDARAVNRCDHRRQGEVITVRNGDATDRDMAVSAQRGQERSLGREGVHRGPVTDRRERGPGVRICRPCLDGHDTLTRCRHAVVEREPLGDPTAFAQTHQAGAGQYQEVEPTLVELSKTRLNVAPDWLEDGGGEERGQLGSPSDATGPIVGDESRTPANPLPLDTWVESSVIGRTMASRGSSRGSTALMLRPGGSCPGRSLALCTATSIVSSRSASSISLTNTDFPPTSDRTAWVSRSPVVVMVMSSQVGPPDRVRAAAAARACHRASGLPLVPILSRFNGPSTLGPWSETLVIACPTLFRSRRPGV